MSERTSEWPQCSTCRFHSHPTQCAVAVANAASVVSPPTPTMEASMELLSFAKASSRCASKASTFDWRSTICDLSRLRLSAVASQQMLLVNSTMYGDDSWNAQCSCEGVENCLFVCLFVYCFFASSWDTQSNVPRVS